MLAGARGSGSSWVEYRLESNPRKGRRELWATGCRECEIGP